MIFIFLELVQADLKSIHFQKQDIQLNSQNHLYTGQQTETEATQHVRITFVILMSQIEELYTFISRKMGQLWQVQPVYIPSSGLIKLLKKLTKTN